LGWLLAGHKVPQQFDGISSDRSHNRNELDDIDPPLSTLVFGDKGLGTLQLACQLMLRQAGLLAGGHHQVAESSLI
jgi:hypothetical protein